MNKTKLWILALTFSLTLVPFQAYGGFFDDLFKSFESPSQEGTQELSLDSTISGLKEALSIGTEKAVGLVSVVNGYMGNEEIKIPMPEKIQKVGNVMRQFGYGQMVDNFELSMNRAAEQAAPQAKDLFIGAIKEMTFDDAKQILNGGDTAATEYLQTKTSTKIYAIFKPIVSTKMSEVGVTDSYKKMMDTFTSLPFMNASAFDLDHYVTNEAMDGLFYMVGQEEKKIRTEPAARVTELLEKVFGS